MARKKIAVITARADDCEQRDVLYGVAQAAFHANADVAVFTNIYNHWVEDALLNYENMIYTAFDPAQFDGVIVTTEPFLTMDTLKDVLAKLRQSGTPCILLGREAAGFFSMESDDAADMMQIVKHLVAFHGFRQIDILTGPPENPASALRLAGCRQALEQLGIPDGYVRIHTGDFWMTSGEALAKRYLSGELPMPEAVVCLNDYTAFGLCDTLTEAGVRIPEQLTVTGYDHHDSRIYHSPLLTTYRRDRRGMGIAAVNRLLGEDYQEAPEDRFVRGDTCTCGTNDVQLANEIRRMRIKQDHATINTVAQFASRLTLCRTLEEYTAVLAEHFYLLHGADRLFFCLDSEWQEALPDGKELLLCEISSDKAGQIRQLPRHALLELLQDAAQTPAITYLLPLVFQMRCFGYAALRYCNPNGYDVSLRDFLKTAANTLEFLRMKNDISYLNQCLRESALHDALTGFRGLKEFRRQLPGDASLLAIQLTFPQEDEALRSEATTSIANALKRVCPRQENCCRTETGFLIAHSSPVFLDKVMAIVQLEAAERFTEQQMFISCACGKDVDAVQAAVQNQAETELRAILRRNEQPYYGQLLQIRRQNMMSPEKIPDTDKASRRLQLSEGYFRSVYKQCFGVSYGSDCISARIIRAKLLLATTSMSIYAIAMKCGYADEKYFARQFRQYVGYSPNQYRNA